MAKINGHNKRRIVQTFGFFILLILLLGFRLAWIQVVRGDEYRQMAVQQQISDIPIDAKRGTIYDRTGRELATSATCYSVWANTAQIKSNYNKAQLREISQRLAVILGEDAKTVKKTLTKEQPIIRIERDLDREAADKVRELQVYGLEIVENTKRFYPMGNFASQALGSVNDDGHGRSGLELQYDDYLSGVAGRWIKDTDAAGNALSYGDEKYYHAEDGFNVISTLDEVLQHYAEKAIAEGMEKTNADRIMCIGMEPDTGDILVMASNPGFDPNEPMVPAGKSEKEAFKQLSDEKQVEYLSEMWKSPLVNDVYEPGSTFKLITTSSVLEEGVATPESTYNCDVRYTVPGTDVTLNCWSPVPHGVQTLKEAVGNSCNPVQIQISAELGKNRYYDYLDMFGITKYTNIDYPGETHAIIQDKENAGPVELATMSYGHGIAITPIQLVTAVSTIANDGIMMQPRMVSRLTDKDGKTVKTFDKKEVRKVISKKTADEMKDIMEYVVSEGGGGNAKIPGYRIGGKTGTAYKSENGIYSTDTYSSFVGVAPIDDPKIVFLVIVDTPKGVDYGSVVAAPIAKAFFQDAFNYLEISPKYTKEELEENQIEKVFVPDLVKMRRDEAIATLRSMGLKYKILPKGKNTGNFKVVDQYPKAGKEIAYNGTVYLYRE